MKAASGSMGVSGTPKVRAILRLRRRPEEASFYWSVCFAVFLCS